jgi:biofilm PGA synthesis N-glycosyltransferase PgaC
MNIIFLCSLTILLYTFVGYPLILRLVKKENNTVLLPDNELPALTVVLCIYNSADLLGKRITNILYSDYPTEKINILIVSDGSTDKPNEVISKMNNPAVRLIHYENNQGKSYALNFAQKYIETSIVAFADIRQSFDHLALKYLASALSNNEIGAVSGNLKIKSADGEEEQGLYWRYEKAIRMKESDLHSLLGVTGAIYIAKTALLTNIPNNSLLDDMYVPLSIVKQGFKVKFCVKAIAYDIASITAKEEFTRKVRTLAGNYQLIKQLPWLLSPITNPLFFQFFSHKVARLFMPFALITLFISSATLDSFNYFFFWAQTFFYGYSLIGFTFKKLKLPFVKTCISFCSLNLAALVAAWKYFSTRDITTLWKKH